MSACQHKRVSLKTRSRCNSVLFPSEGAPGGGGGPGRHVRGAPADVPGARVGDRLLCLRLRGAAEEHRVPRRPPVPVPSLHVPVRGVHAGVHSR